MKKYLFALCLLFCSLLAFAQPSAFAIHNSHKPPSAEAVALGLSGKNKVDVGAQLLYTLSGTQEGLKDNVLLSGIAVYDLSIGKLKIPVISNVNIDFSGGDGGFLNGDKGLSIGVYPYKVISEGNVTTVIHGALAYKLLPGETKYTAQQAKISAGIELAKKILEDSYPLTVSATPFYAINNLENENFLGFEVTAVIPVNGGLGLLAEYTAPFSKTVDSAFRLGLIAIGALRK